MLRPIPIGLGAGGPVPYDGGCGATRTIEDATGERAGRMADAGVETAHLGVRGRCDPVADVGRFAFYRDPAFWLGCTAYAINRCLLSANLPIEFLRAHFNDIWLVPCALPLVLWVHDRMGWRASGPPRGTEVAAHLVGWSILFEWLGPAHVPWATGDPEDVLWYAIGAAAAWAWWQAGPTRGAGR